MNILVLSDNHAILERAKPIFLKRTDVKYCFTNSDDINPKKDYIHIIATYSLVFSLHCKKIFPKQLVEGVRCINIHPGLSRGMLTHVHDMAKGFDSGTMIHLMDEWIDTGRMLYGTQVFLKDSETSLEYYNRIVDEEMRLLAYSLNSLIDAKYPTLRNQKRPYYSRKDFDKLCEIDLDKTGTFREFYNLLRALSHGDYLNAHIKGTKTYLKLTIHEKN